MKLYIYNKETFEVVETIEGSTVQECESKADGKYDLDDYAWTYTDNQLVF